MFARFKEKEFMDELRKENWEEIMETDDINDAAIMFNEKFTRILDKLCPVKSVQFRNNYTPWKTPELKDLETRTN